MDFLWIAIMRDKIIVGNWKMHGRLDQVDQLLMELVTLMATASTHARCILLPPAIYIALAQNYLKAAHLLSRTVFLGGQNIYPYDYGAFTGEHSVLMYQDFECQYMLVGHS